LSLKKNVIANYVGQAWRVLMGVVFVPLYIKYMGVEAYGLVGIFTILQTWLTLLDAGTRPALAREMSRYSAGACDIQSIRNLLRSVEILGAAISGGAAICIAIASHWLATTWLSTSNIPPEVIAKAMSIMGVVAAFRFIENIYVSGLFGLNRQLLPNAVMVATSTIRGVGAIGVLAWISPTVTAFFVWQLIISAATTLVYGWCLYRNLLASSSPGRFSLAALVGVRRFAAGTLGITFLALLLTQIDKILLVHLLSLEAFSYYTLGGAVAGGLNSLTLPVATTYYPRFTQLVTIGDHETLANIYHQAAQLVAVVAGSAAIVLVVFSDRILLLWTGNANLTEHVSGLLAVLTAGTLMNGLMWIPYQAQMAHGWTSLTVFVNASAVVLLVPAIVLIVPRYGALGAAWVWVVLNAGYLIIDIYFMHRRILKSEKWRWYRDDNLRPLASSAAVAVLIRWVLPAGLGKVAEFGALAATSCAVAGAAALSASLIRLQIVRYATRSGR
jgi:O-antigen/teichoic acid export membrane protein